MCVRVCVCNICIFRDRHIGARPFPRPTKLESLGMGPEVTLEIPLFNDPRDVGTVISGSSVFSKSCLNIWKLTVHLKPGLENFEHYFASA